MLHLRVCAFIRLCSKIRNLLVRKVEFARFSSSKEEERSAKRCWFVSLSPVSLASTETAFVFFACCDALYFALTFVRRKVCFVCLKERWLPVLKN